MKERNAVWRVGPAILIFRPLQKATVMRIRPMLQAIRRFRMAATGQKSPYPHLTAREAVVHDPAAQQPHDLDDPYFDPKVQRRFADVISNAMLKKRWNNSA